MHELPYILQNTLKKIQSDLLAERLRLMHSIHVWHCYDLQKTMNSITPEDRVNADLEDITVEQYAFNKWMNELEEANDAKETFTQCIMFTSSFHSPVKGGGAWEADEEYTDWQWWLGRADGGEWKLMTWGY